MKKNLLIKIILVVISLIFITIIAMIFTMKDNKKENSDIGNIKITDTQVNENNMREEKIIPVTDENEFYRVSQTINDYYNTINKSTYILLDGTDMSDDEEIKTSILSILSQEYINKNNISITNVYKYVENIQNSIRFIPLKMKKLEGFGINKYIINGNLINMEENNNLKTVYIFLNVDFYNNTFSIEPIVEEYKNIDDVDYKNTIEQIEKNEYNEYMKLNMLTEDIIKERYSDFKLMLINDSKYTYENLLDPEYREKRFGSYDKFWKFLEENEQISSEIYLEKYKINNYEDYTEYVCVDKNENYCIFKEKNASDINVILDTYTIDVPEFIERYNKGKEQIKVGMNIEKITQALNKKDYNYIYGKLDETFKQDNFNTIDKFETYMKNNFFEINKANYEKFSKEGEIYIYQLKIKDSEEENANSKDITVIMKLLEDTNFVMSFNVN